MVSASNWEASDGAGYHPSLASGPADWTRMPMGKITEASAGFEPAVPLRVRAQPLKPVRDLVEVISSPLEITCLIVAGVGFAPTAFGA